MGLFHKKLSKGSKIWLALVIVLCVCAACAAALWYAGKVLFLENPRFIVREVRLECGSGFWAGKTERDRMEKAKQFARESGILPGDTNIFMTDLRRVRTDLLQSHPEIEQVSVRRILPDLIVFEIVPRIPRADIGRGFYLDDNGTVIPKKYSANLEKSLPLVGEVPSIALRKNLVAGDRIESDNLLLALRFIRMIDTSEDPCVKRITVKQIVSVRNPDNEYLRCQIFYKDDPVCFWLTLPVGLTEEKLSRDIPERLIPRLEQGLRSPESNRAINLIFENQSIGLAPGR